MSKKSVYSSLREQVYDKGAKWPLLTQLQFVTNEIDQTNKQTKNKQTNKQTKKNTNMCSSLSEGNDVKLKLCFAIVCTTELGRMNFEMYLTIMRSQLKTNTPSFE